MGKHLTHSRTPLDQIAPTSIKYSLAKRIALAEDAAAGYPYRKIAARHGVALSTIHAAVKSEEIREMIDPDIVDRRRKSMATIYEYQADISLSTITQEDWKKERATSRVIGAATCTDKARLLRGEATENISVRGTVELINSEVLELRKKREILESGLRENVQKVQS